MAEFVEVAKVADIPKGKGLRVVVERKKIALFNVDGEIYAIDDTCSHAEASLSDGELSGCVVECPRHGARFDVRTGAALSMPAWAPVERYDVKVEGDTVKVAI